jgi:hypothetical protein
MVCSKRKNRANIGIRIVRKPDLENSRSKHQVGSNAYQDEFSATAFAEALKWTIFCDNYDHSWVPPIKKANVWQPYQQMIATSGRFFSSFFALG